MSKGKCKNYSPISIEDLARGAGVPVEEARRFFVENFGSYEEYLDSCFNMKALDTRLGEMVEEHKHGD